MSSPETLTVEEILLAADRFEVASDANGTTMQLADDFMAPGKDLSTIDYCLEQADVALAKGWRVIIERTP